ncbi:MAG: hypothetical protein WCS26_08555, partial [Arcobacteraceae bacterium]
NATNIKNDLVSSSGSGIVIKCDDEEELKKVILKLKEDNNFYEKYSHNGQKFVENNFVEEKIEEKLKIIMDKLRF